jgi:tryptophan synthase alpha chain
VPFHFEAKPSLVAYVTCGDPDLATTRAVILAAIEAGASIIELGVPFSDPLADGPVIQRASERALKQGVSLQNVLTLASEIREHSQSVGLVIFSYLNPILRMGLAKFCQVARLAGIDGTLITDLPVEESAEYLREARKNDLATIFLAAPTSTDQRLKLISQVSAGFIYAVSRTGVTGARQQMTVRNLDPRAIQNSGEICRRSRCRQRHRPRHRTKSRTGSRDCGRICETAFSHQPSAINRPR